MIGLAGKGKTPACYALANSASAYWVAMTHDDGDTLPRPAFRCGNSLEHAKGKCRNHCTNLFKDSVGLNAIYFCSSQGQAPRQNGAAEESFGVREFQSEGTVSILMPMGSCRAPCLWQQKEVGTQTRQDC
eukprot:1221534-Amphidinium_carterae.1